MKILISPAKSLDYNQSIVAPFYSNALFLKEADYLMKKLSKLNLKKLMKMMHISEEIAELNVSRNNNWEIPLSPTIDIKPAVTVFTGEVYRGLDVASFSEDDFFFAQDNLRILSGLYGILKPLDLMYPYRLEMGTKWDISPKIKNLYIYWGDKITQSLKNELLPDESIINLASSEYFKSIQSKKIENRIITPVFKELKNGEYKVVMMYAKNARGQMAKFIIKNRINHPEEIKNFNLNNYRFDENLSDENEWVFTR